jgi:hypothetical protein
MVTMTPYEPYHLITECVDNEGEMMANCAKQKEFKQKTGNNSCEQCKCERHIELCPHIPTNDLQSIQ